MVLTIAFTSAFIRASSSVFPYPVTSIILVLPETLFSDSIPALTGVAAQDKEHISKKQRQPTARNK
jgi:hypothetical protein